MAEAAVKTETPAATDAQPDTYKQAREFLIQSKIYRTMAQIFAVLGIGAAAFLYYQSTGGDFRHIMENPFMAIVMIIPFLPAVVLSMKAKKAEKSYAKLAVPPKAE